MTSTARPVATSSAPQAYPHLGRWLQILVIVLIVVLSLVQAPGLTTFDTKLDLTQDPGAFMRGALTVWTPSVNMGSLQNQAYGYLFPVGPFYLVGDVLGIPMWLWQRVWSMLLLLIAFEGMRRVARAMGGLTPVLAVLAGAAFAFSPRMLSTVGVLSGQSLPGAVLPWTVLPLVHAARGRLSWRKAVVLSAASVPFMGGVNAAEVICALLVPGVFVLLSPGAWRARLRRTAAWSGLVLVVCIWWIGPLLVLGGYAAPFLDYIESARNTTAPVGWLETVRGSTHWLAFLDPAESDWVTGYRLTYEPLFVIVTAAAGFAGVVGLTLRRTPFRAPIAITTLGAALLLTLGHGGPAGSPLQSTFLDFLDGPGSPFRNIHKLDMVVRFGLVIGLAHLAAALAPRARRFFTRAGSSVEARHAASGVAAVLALLLVTVPLIPAAEGQMRSAHGWKRIPQPWQQMSRTLQGLPEDSRTLVVPGPGFGEQTWGRTIDELIQTFPGVSWGSRSQVPLIPPGGLRLLDSIETMFWSGRASSSLSTMLADAGFTHLLVRNDISPRVQDAPDPDRVHQTLAGSPGFARRQAYGVGQGGYPMVELFQVGAGRAGPRAVPLGEARPLYGEASDIVSLQDSGALRPGDLAVSPAPDAERRTNTIGGGGALVTEGNERRERNFGRVHEAQSSIRAPGDPWTQTRAAHDYGAMVTSEPSTVGYRGISSLRVSSTADSPATFGPVRPDLGGWAALDGTPQTAWVSALGSKPQDQWIEVGLQASQLLGTVGFQLRESAAGVRSVRVVTDRESHVVRLDSRREGSVQLRLPARTVRLEVAGASGRGQVGVSELSFSGVTPQRNVRVPAVLGDGDTAVFSTRAGRSACVVSSVGVGCNPATFVGPEEGNGLNREVTVDKGGPIEVTGQVLPTGGEQTDNLLLPLKDGIAVRANGSYVTDVRNSPTQAADGSSATVWIPAQSADEQPWLDLSWGQRRTIREFRVEAPPGAFPPPVVGLTVNGRLTKFTTTAKGTYKIPSAPSTSSLRLFFPAKRPLSQVAEIDVPALKGLYYRPDDSVRTGLPCGLGPTVRVGASTVRTEVTGTMGQLRTGQPMQVRTCERVPQLGAGRQQVSMGAVNGFIPITMRVSPRAEAPTTRALKVTRGEWTANDRRLGLAAGPWAVLAVPENYNRGWEARLGDRVLDTVMVNGWQQGWVVPPSAQQRDVELRFTPSLPYRVSLVAGALLALAVVLLGAVLLRRSRLDAEGDRPAEQRWTGSAPLLGGATLVVCAVMGGPVLALGALVGLLLSVRWADAARGLVLLLGAGAGVVWSTGLDVDVERPLADVLAAIAVGVAIGLACMAFVPSGSWRLWDPRRTRRTDG